MAKEKTQVKGVRKTGLKSRRPAKSGDKPDINRAAEIQRMYDEMGLGSELERLAYRRLSPPPKKKPSYTLRWYMTEDELVRDTMQRKQNAQSA